MIDKNGKEIPDQVLRELVVASQFKGRYSNDEYREILARAKLITRKTTLISGRVMFREIREVVRPTRPGVHHREYVALKGYDILLKNGNGKVVVDMWLPIEGFNRLFDRAPDEGVAT